MPSIRQAHSNEFSSIWPLFQAVIKTGDSHVFPIDMSESDAEHYWMNPAHKVFVAENDEQLVATYILKANHLGLGSHIANASFMVDPMHHGKGIGSAIGSHCIQTAKELGFKGIQYNIVISTNHAAVALWKKLGFQIIGTTPKGFKHLSLGYVDTYIMYREL